MERYKEREEKMKDEKIRRGFCKGSKRHLYVETRYKREKGYQMTRWGSVAADYNRLKKRERERREERGRSSKEEVDAQPIKFLGFISTRLSLVAAGAACLPCMFYTYVYIVSVYITLHVYRGKRISVPNATSHLIAFFFLLLRVDVEEETAQWTTKNHEGDAGCAYGGGKRASVSSWENYCGVLITERSTQAAERAIDAARTILIHVNVTFVRHINLLIFFFTN